MGLGRVFQAGLMEEDITPPDNIVEFTGKKREPDAAMLVPVDPRACIHFNTSFTVDVDGSKCFCKGCGGEVSTIFVLKRLMDMESGWLRNRARYLDEMRRLTERSQTKCRSCGAMTRISRS